MAQKSWKRLRSGLLVYAAALVSSVQCAGFEEGIVVELAVVHHASSAGPDGGGDDGEPRAFTTDLGYQVALTEARVAVAQLDLVRCDGHASRGFVATAYAHDTRVPPTRLVLAHVEDMLGPDGVLTPLGALRPPPGAYCGLRVLLAPADDAGDTLVVRGVFRGPGDAADTPFEIRTARAIETGVMFPRVLELAADARDAEAVLELHYEEWLDGVELRALQPAELESAVVANLRLSMHHADVP